MKTSGIALGESLGQSSQKSKEDLEMKKLLSILFAAMIGWSLSMATFAQEVKTEPTKKSETKKAGHHHKVKGARKNKAAKPAETK